MSDSRGGSEDEEITEQLIALGYIDPGAGSSMWQIVLAGFFRMSDGLRSGIRKIFGTRKTRGEEETD